jgi:Mn-containing catalase
LFPRIDRPRIEPPRPKDASPDRAAAVQDLHGGRFGKTSALMYRACVSTKNDHS